MVNQRFTLEEFEALFPDRFASREDLLREYESFLRVFEQLDRSSVPELSIGQKAEIFRRSWQGQRRSRSLRRIPFTLIRRPAIAFAAGIVLGCFLTFTATNRRLELVPPVAAADQPLNIEHVGRTQTYTGKAIDGLYPQIENPKIVLERTERSREKRVLYGTVDDGQIYVVWNL